MSRIVVGCCVGDWGRYRANVVPAADRLGAEVYGAGGQTHIARAYNAIMRAVRVTMLPGDALLLVHDDLEITDPDAERVIFDAVDCYDVAGPVGASKPFDGIMWWEAGLVGRQQTDNMTVGTAPYRGPAFALDGSCLILSCRAVKHLSFDEAIPAGFHGYDADLCRFARRMLRHPEAVGVVPLATHHHTTVGFKSPAIAASWQAAHEYVQQKWSRSNVPV